MDVFELEYKFIENHEEKTMTVRTIERNGSYYIQLPEGINENGNMVQKAIRISGKKWQFVSRSSDDTYFSSVYLSDDGTVQYENGNGEVVTLHDAFDPLLANSDFPYNIAAQMYYLKEQFDYLLEIQSKVKDIRRKRLEKRLRKLGYASIEDALGILKEHSIFCDINEICKDLENYEDYIEIPGFSRREETVTQGRREQCIVYTVPTEKGKENIRLLFEKLRRDLKVEDDRTEEKKEMLDRKFSFIEQNKVRKLEEFGMTFPGIMSMTEREWEKYTSYITGICKEYWPKKPKFFDELRKRGITYAQIQGMNEEEWKKFVESITRKDDYEGPEFFEKSIFDSFEYMPEANMTFVETPPKRSVQLHNSVWNRYTKAIAQVARLYLSLNADILPAQIARQVEDNTGIYGKETEDFREGEDLRTLIADFIDSPVFTIAGNIEDIAVCARNLDFIDYVDTVFYKNGDGIGGGLRDSIMELRDDSTEQIKTRMSHVARFNNAQIKLQQLRGVKRTESAPDFEEI